MVPPLIGGLASRADSDISSEPGRGRVEETLPGSITGVLTSLVATSFVFHFLVQRYRQVSQWRKLSYIDWLILALFVDSWLFFAGSTVLQFGGFDVNVDSRACAAGSYMCVVGYFISKLIYLLLVERFYVIRDKGRGRLKSKLYILNLVAVLLCYVAWLPIYMVFHISHNNSGVCIIGVHQRFLSTAFACDVGINLWLTSWFLYPLMKLKPEGANRLKAIVCPRRASQDADSSVVRLYNLARRTFLGSVITLTATSLNLGVSIGYDGLSAWLCLMLCRIDVFICAAVIYWITQKEPAPPSYQDRPWGVPNYRGTDFTTLVGNSSMPGPRPARAFDGVGGDAHPGSLVPGSLHLGRFGNSGEDLQESHMSVKSAPESQVCATGSDETSIRQDRSDVECEIRQHGGL
ncbi:hypothetical protein INS49_012748 [Diaporthe citri]|uniref:uncharacterized protein n=1 Tax=Diaporthe citri TaxID=83186 RepID=UPI001C7E9C23|nr:uncharacterized protein INS49_012748 [Diaporthe citri]KAG6359227.1 hypothetical protein INS49_012748 [Diaporthe citri]